jgi:hypothetical protein
MLVEQSGTRFMPAVISVVPFALLVWMDTMLLSFIDERYMPGWRYHEILG